MNIRQEGVGIWGWKWFLITEGRVNSPKTQIFPAWRVSKPPMLLFAPLLQTSRSPILALELNQGRGTMRNSDFPAELFLQVNGWSSIPKLGSLMRNKIPHLCHCSSETEPWELSKHLRKVIFHFNTHIHNFPAEKGDCGQPIGHFLHKRHFQGKMSHLDNWVPGERNPHCFHSSG